VHLAANGHPSTLHDGSDDECRPSGPDIGPINKKDRSRAVAQSVAGNAREEEADFRFELSVSQQSIDTLDGVLHPRPPSKSPAHPSKADMARRQDAADDFRYASEARLMKVLNISEHPQ
jgi:hypothetical protein